MMEDSTADSQSSSSRSRDRHRAGGGGSNKQPATSSTKSSSSNSISASQILDQLKLSESDKRRKLREIEVSQQHTFRDLLLSIKSERNTACY